jgi:hypothetical protein
VLYNLSRDPEESTDVAAANPEVVQQIMKMAASTRLELGEYLQRGTGQRATGSAVAGAPVISNEKDWGLVEPAMDATLAQERRKRHPEAVEKKNKRRK